MVVSRDWQGNGNYYTLRLKPRFGDGVGFHFDKLPYGHSGVVYGLGF